MQVGLRYESTYRYAEPVGFSPHEVRLLPRGDRFCHVRRIAFEVNGGATVRYSRDVFDNVVALCFFAEKFPELQFRLSIDLDLEERDPFDFILETHALELPFEYEPELNGILAPYLKRHTSGALEVPCWTTPAEKRSGTVSALVHLNHALHDAIAYERREEGSAHSPEETLRLGSGACRDVAVLHAELLRSIGLAARLVSGYLRESNAASKRAEGSLHAWVEAFLPGAGWVGMDATNGVFANHNWIAAAVGLQPRDITPIAGSYYHARKISSEMTSRLELIDL